RRCYELLTERLGQALLEAGELLFEAGTRYPLRKRGGRWRWGSRGCRGWEIRPTLSTEEVARVALCATLRTDRGAFGAASGTKLPGSSVFKLALRALHGCLRCPAPMP